MNDSRLLNRLLAAVARGVALPWYARRLRRFEVQLERARELQRAQLLTLVERGRNTRFGRDHHFPQIRTVDDYRRHVPVAGYEHFAPYIDSVAQGDLNALFPPSEHLLRFTVTTGTTGVPKLNPVTETWLREYRASWDLWSVKLALDHPQVVGTKLLQLAGTWDMGQTPSGVPISMVSALASRCASPIVRRFYAVPLAVASIRDPLAKYYTMLRLTMTQNVGVIIAIAPGALLRLAELGNSERQRLIRDIHDGTLSRAFDVSEEIRQTLAPQIRRPAPEQARRLERLAEQSGTLYPRDYWPNPVIGCWLGGTAGYQARHLREFFGDSPLRDLGLVSSEGRHTIPLHDDQPFGVLAATTNYYEFIPISERTPSGPAAVEAHELQTGCDYSLVMTTPGGYYRFEIGDVVRCRGYVGQAPVLEFLQKLGRCGDLEGEKLTEHQFIQAAEEAAREQTVRLGYVTAVPFRPNKQPPCYVILVKHGDLPDRLTATRFLEAVDRRLAAGNFLYGGHRRALLLGPPRLWRLPNGAWSNYVQSEQARRGTGDVQYKHPTLVPDAALLDRFQPVDIIEIPQVQTQAAA